MAKMPSMSDDKPDPMRDTLKGLGLLFRAARTVAARIPTKNLEDAVMTSAREVGRAIENVASTIERGVLGKDSPPPPRDEVEPPAPKPDDRKGESPGDGHSDSNRPRS